MRVFEYEIECGIKWKSWNFFKGEKFKETDSVVVSVSVLLSHTFSFWKKFDHKRKKERKILFLLKTKS